MVGFTPKANSYRLLKLHLDGNSRKAWSPGEIETIKRGSIAKADARFRYKVGDGGNEVIWRRCYS